MLERKRSKLTTYALTLVMAGMVCTANAQQISGKTVLKNMLSAEGKVTFIGREVTVLSKAPAITSEQIVYRAGSKGMRMEYVRPPKLSGEIRADDGHTLAHYIPKDNILKIRPSRLAEMHHWMHRGAHGFGRGDIDVQFLGKDSVAGRSAYVVQLAAHMHEKGMTRKIWVDTEKWIKLKTLDVGPDGKVASKSYFTKIDFVDSIPDSKFKITTPAGVKVVHEPSPRRLVTIDQAKRQAGFRLMSPTYLPPGFKAVGAIVIPFRGDKLVAFRYTDGVNSLSLFQTPGNSIGRGFLERLHHGPEKTSAGVYSWRQGNMNLTIVSQISTDQIRKIAQSVK